MSRRTKAVVAGAGFVLVAIVAFWLMGNRSATDLPLIGDIAEPPRCPLSGEEPRRDGLVERPAVAVKIVNSAAAYPLSGLEDAEIVYEELVEGGATRFLALYHCTDAEKAGPVRSARAVDPAIMTPATRILAFSGANAPVRAALAEAGIVEVDEDTPGGALGRVERAGVSFEHTLYADTRTVRRVGRESHDEPPPGDSYAFGTLRELGVRGRPAEAVTVEFSAGTIVVYEWRDGAWFRSQGGAPFVAESGEQVATENVLVEEHEVVFSDIRDVAGAQSIEIADVTGSGRAMLFRDGRAIPGRWTRDSVQGPVRFTTRRGDEMLFAPGSIWIHLVPSETGEVRGSFSFEGGHDDE